MGKEKPLNLVAEGLVDFLEEQSPMTPRGAWQSLTLVATVGVHFPGGVTRYFARSPTVHYPAAELNVSWPRAPDTR
jgi:hypothetical protein